ncbi:protein transport protein Sec16A-like isoform X3 [Sitodiplosis mosellana]|uniref:protein transport protein Sec16A-like isoform X3 n=1 Tax=Sitodiplosis mosellana TaxID=263140 RepID=UPI00244418FD|nr:protein transport protein Sec16A-like isoform X3 [Sitodiplosis mosellana]
MSTPFASKLFENSSNNTDGWDEWDWVDNNNSSSAKGQQQAQFISQPVQIGFAAQNIQAQVSDNGPNYLGPSNQIPPPTIDQFTATLPNNNQINNASGFYQDDNFQFQASFVNNIQSANNNFVQSATPSIQHVHSSSNSVGFMQIEGHETTITPVPVLTPPTGNPAIDQNIQNVPLNAKSEIGMVIVASAQIQNPPAATLLESNNAPSVPVFSNNLLPPVLPPPAFDQSPFANTNPFKRVGSHAHRTPPPPPVLTASSTGPIPTAEIFNNPLHSPDTNDPITHNDRNEYLQTGHLSGDGEINVLTSTVDTQTLYSSSDGNGDSLPPPGLSRFVLGEQETNESNNIQPPPGLDRLVTGTEINQSDINMERQADGQDNADATVPPPVISRNNSQFSSVQAHPSASNLSSSHSIESQSYENDNFEPISESDRNQYLVAGENIVDNTASAKIISNANIQRVVTGLENVENQDISLPKNQRELDMDGENIEDQQQQQQQTQSRLGNTTNTLSHTDSVEDLDTSGNYNQKFQSNASTGDDSDRDKAYYNRNKGQSNKRVDERRKKRDDLRYETEDTDHSNREKRHPKDSDRYTEKERGHRGRNVDIDDDDSRTYRRGEKQYRPPSRDDEDRYEGRYRYGDGRSHRENRYRYETDGSHYEKKDSRYDRNQRFNDREREDNYGRYRDDRYYKSKEYDRESRDERDRFRVRDDRYSDYDSTNKSRRGRKKDRSGNGSERGDYSSGYYHPTVAQIYGYDPYSSYYQHQQYYENLRRTNPIAYAEWYNRYFASQLTAAASAVVVASDGGRESGRESVHSGRSSSKDNNDRYMLSANPTFYQSFGANKMHSHAQRLSHKEFSTHHNSTLLDNASTILHRTHEQPYYASSDIGSRSPFTHKLEQQLNSLDGAATSLEPERLTPLKFTSTHSCASFQNGLLVCVKQKYLPSNEMQNNVHLLKFALNNQTKRLYQMFPGPLTPISHTKQVIDYCLEQIRHGPNVSNLNSRSTSNSMSSLQSVDQSSRASFALLWNFLILLLRQRGVFVGSDIAELLLKNKDEFPYEQPQLNSTKLSTAQKDNGETLSDVESKDESNVAISNDSEQQQTSLSEWEVTEKFREFLLYGSINEALEWATENNLWGHALFLASKMDRRSHANVMIKFANKLPLADPLQTLYQLKSSRIPLSVTSTQDEKWGDWRPHLAMIISNPSQSNTELDRKAIITMGDTLHNRGDLFAAQFCYLMAKVEFSKYSDVKHDASMILNNTSNAVRLILLGASCYKSSFAEFASDEAIIMTEIYEYACSLANSQFSIAEFQPYKYLLGTRMLDYGFHLKSLLYMEQVALHIQKNPSQYERSFIEKVYNVADKLKYFDPVLEKSLDNLNEEDGTMQSGGQLQWQQDLFNLLGQTQTVYAENTGSTIPVDPYQHQHVSLPPTTNVSSQIDQEFSQINKQFQGLSLQYQNPTYEYESLGVESSSAQTVDVNSYVMEQPPNQYKQQPPISYEPRQPSDLYGQQQPEFSGKTNTGYLSEQQPSQTHQLPLYNEQLPYGSSEFGINEVPKPTISMPNSFQNKPGFYEGAADSVANTESESNKGADMDKKQSQQQTQKKQAPNCGTNDNSRSGWIGGIFNKLTFKPKNQMILPDDKNPSIIWDEQNKRWINKDQDEDEKESFKPPPKMAELPAMTQPLNISNKISNIPTSDQMHIMHTYGSPMLSGSNMQDSNVNSSNDPILAAPSLQSNMFKMQRNKTLKKSYVDVFNPSGAAPKNDIPILAPMMPMMPTLPTQPSFFVPAATVPNTKEQNQDEFFYNSNQYGGGGYQQQ